MAPQLNLDQLAVAVSEYALMQKAGLAPALTSYTLEPYQEAPPGEWLVWMLLGGRGSGKTLGGADYVLQHLRKYKSDARVVVGAPTTADARDYCAEGKTGLWSIAKSEFRTYNRSLLEMRHNLGGYVKFLSADAPERWRGGNWTCLWADELASWEQESWDNVQFALRDSVAPRIVTTTPKPRKFLKELMDDPETVVRRVATFDNPHLGERAVEYLRRRYGGTRLGRQELYAEMVEDIEGAMWEYDWIANARRSEIPPLVRVVTAVDPAVTHGPESDETGIAVAGKGEDGDYYVLASDGVRLSPHGWARRALSLHHEYSGDKIIGETNNGGEMVEATIKQVDRDAPFKKVVASKGKHIRAEPIAALYEQGRVHHVGVFGDLEEQECNFPVAVEHEDRLDANVYAITELMGPEKRFTAY